MTRVSSSTPSLFLHRFAICFLQNLTHFFLCCARAACVREAAVRGLVKVSERGNEAVVMAMASLIEEETAVTVKKAAVRET
jgi:hypothetical protein